MTRKSKTFWCWFGGAVVVYLLTLSFLYFDDGSGDGHPVMFLAIVLVVIGIRLVAGAFDADRVEQYVQDRGWELVDRSWDPFGPGWFGEKDSRIYEIVYRDQDGQLHRAHVKTSMFSGVYLTKDRIVDPGEAEPSDLEHENARLKQRIAALEAESGTGSDEPY